LVITAVAVFAAPPTQAGTLTSRSITLINGASDGGSKPSGVVNHKFTFTPVATSIGSMRFTYCSGVTAAPMASCTNPTGFTSTGSSLASTTFTGIPGTWTLANTGTAGFTVSAASAQTSSGAITLQLNAVTNPSAAAGTTFWVQIETYASTTVGSMGSGQDLGVVAAATVPQFTVSGYMPESLVFCVGTTVNSTCSTVTGSSTNLGTFSPVTTTSGTSMFAASTNATSGYAITYTGDTLKSGANAVTAMSSATTSSIGTSQFGINLMNNTGPSPCPTVGAAVSPANNGSNFNGNPIAGYNTACTFKFTPITAANAGGVGGGTAPDTIANSTSGATKTSDAQAYTVSYLVNVSGNQPAGSYSTVLTYVATATF
jgi:hypothetical protein